MSKKSRRTRRFLKRMAERKQIDYREAIVSFYGKEVSKINKNLLISLLPDRPNDRIF